VSSCRRSRPTRWPWSTTSIHPIATVTLALPKTGLANPGARAGELHLADFADFGIPKEALEAAGIHLGASPYTSRGWTVLDPTDRHEPEPRAPSTARQTPTITGA
jgi:hypothetical protein